MDYCTDDGYIQGEISIVRDSKKMLTEIENGKIRMVIVKDMSRFGRNYLQVSFYTEIMFPQKQVRFMVSAAALV